MNHLDEIQRILRERQVTLYELIAQNDFCGFDLCDEYDNACFMECKKNWEDCDDYIDATWLLLAINVYSPGHREPYTPIDLARFIQETEPLWCKYLNEVNREEYRPENFGVDGITVKIPYDGSVNGHSFHMTYMQEFWELLRGNVSETVYRKFFEIFADKETSDKVAAVIAKKNKLSADPAAGEDKDENLSAEEEISPEEKKEEEVI